MKGTSSDGKNLNQNHLINQQRDRILMQNITSPSETTIYTCGTKPNNGNNQGSSDEVTMETSSDSDNFNLNPAMSNEINRVLNEARSNFANSFSDDGMTSTSSGFVRSQKNLAHEWVKTCTKPGSPQSCDGKSW